MGVADEPYAVEGGVERGEGKAISPRPEPYFQYRSVVYIELGQEIDPPILAKINSAVLGPPVRRFDFA